MLLGNSRARECYCASASFQQCPKNRSLFLRLLAPRRGDAPGAESGELLEPRLQLLHAPMHVSRDRKKDRRTFVVSNCTRPVWCAV
jgi:hypothetical protein